MVQFRNGTLSRELLFKYSKEINMISFVDLQKVAIQLTITSNDHTFSLPTVYKTTKPTY